MRIKEFSKKITALACAATLAVGAFAGYTPVNTQAALPDIILDGDEGTHESAMIGKKAGTDKEYVYDGWVNVKVDRKTAPKYKYLILTYTGDIEFVRFEFVRFVDLNGNLKDLNNMETEVVWFNPNVEKTGKDFPFVAYNNVAIPYDTVSSTKNTIVLDLTKTVDDLGPIWEYFCDGIHIHNGAGTVTAEGFRKVGSFNITNARLSTSPKILPSDKEDVKFDVTKKPGKAKVKSVAKKKYKANKVKVTLKKVKKAKGYEVQVAKARKFSKKNILVKATKSKVKITLKSKKLKKQKKLYVRARAYVLNASKKKVWGDWSSAKAVKIKK